MADAPETPPAPEKKRGLPFWVYLLLMLPIAAGGYLGAAHLSGGAYPTFGLPLGGEAGLLRRTSVAFWEDIQFKDFEQAASYHSPDKQASVDIPYLIERLFAVKPEALDIMSYEIVFVDVDSTGLRARIRCRVRINELIRDEIDDRDIVLYYKRESPSAPWYMDLESSLRTTEAEEGKKH